jgi:Peptidase inhibitor family I36
MQGIRIGRTALLGALAAIALFAGVFLTAAAPRASADSNCFANSICIWTAINYGGDRQVYACANAGNSETPFGETYRSAKNRCGSVYNILYTSSGAVCMGPGGDRPSPGGFQVFAILNFGASC